MNELQQCTVCKEIKLVIYFYWNRKTDRHRAECKQCHKESQARRYVERREEILAGHRKWREIGDNGERMKARIRAWHYLNRYGMTEDDKLALIEAQGGCCAICRIFLCDLNKRRVHVDHCHKTGKVRGILCHSCNQVLGNARDEIDVLESAIYYLHESKDALARLRELKDSGGAVFT